MSASLRGRIHDWFYPSVALPNHPSTRYDPLSTHDDPLPRSSLESTLSADERRSYAASDTHPIPPFSWVSYGVFCWAGIVMLWGWNMFLAAAPYFQTRFASSPWLLDHFQASVTSIFMVVTLAIMYLLTVSKSSSSSSSSSVSVVSYPKRILSAYYYTLLSFVLLALATVPPLASITSPWFFYFFLLIMVAFVASASGLLQNGGYAYCASFGRSEYTQAVMTGQAIAGVLPPLTQIIAVLSVRHDGADNDPQPPTLDDRPPGIDTTHGNNATTSSELTSASQSAFIYFSTAVVVTVLAIFSFRHLLQSPELLPLSTDQSHSSQPHTHENSEGHEGQSGESPVSASSATFARVRDQERGHFRPTMQGDNLPGPQSTFTEAETEADLEFDVNSPRLLFAQLQWASLATFFCFMITMVYPVYTIKIMSTHWTDYLNHGGRDDAGDQETLISTNTPNVPFYAYPSVFIPIAFLFWNAGDLLGRVFSAVPVRLQQHPRGLFGLSLLRLFFVPLYAACSAASASAVNEAAASMTTSTSSSLLHNDLFYLVVVQGGFGFTNGWIGSTCMMMAASPHWVPNAKQREAAGGFMALCLVAGLSAGSVLSFFVG